MATITLSRPLAPYGTAPPDIKAPANPPCTFVDGIGSSVNLSSQCAVAVPNKHIPVCPTGPSQASDPGTPPASSRCSDQAQQSSLLYPPNNYVRLHSEKLTVYEISACQLAQAIDFSSRQPLPPPSSVFPWLHGLHPSNQMQQNFFMGRRRPPRTTPSCLRGITVVKANGDLSCGRLKGAVAPDEFLRFGPPADFIEADPPDGFSVRNFHIQPAKMAFTSDIVVYGEDAADVCKVAWDISTAQVRWRELHAAQGQELPEYNTFICTSSIREFEETHHDLVSIDTNGNFTGKVLDFVLQERREMLSMTKTSEISHNVFMGPTPDPKSDEEQRFDILIECCDFGRLNPSVLQSIVENISETSSRSYLDFPSSGSILPPSWSQDEADGILDTCRLMYHLAHGTQPSVHDATRPGNEGSENQLDDPISANEGNGRKILIHCADGYTETSLLGIAYLSYSTGRPVPDAWLHLHTCKQRNFFAYPSDVALLTSISPRLLRESPVHSGRTVREMTNLIENEPAWLPRLDGSLPSRILDYLYLGNLNHANNPDLLIQLSIKQLLSVEEETAWKDDVVDAWGPDNVCVVQAVQDNGIDPLTNEFARCLEFIERGRLRGTATLVHCRVGVSRSATICIVEVMRALNMTFPRAYCFVRARRLNVIIQPHLRFAYELLRWEELIQEKSTSDKTTKRELEWREIAREIATMNRPYSRG